MENRVTGTERSEPDVGGERRDELFEVLTDPYRRVMLHSLQRTESPVTVAELAADVVAWSDQRQGTDRSDIERSTVEVSLVHKHLPMMADSGVVRYDEDRKTVTPSDRADEVQSHLGSTASD
ncbi:DUF7344 domain-containing protein [Halosimplex salinum]|uniref:DUF7344 domain-containing protein n=1 Tax=Halosimplex salinum TaxID=1710538 RepID=UPI000F474338|nr:helix-turn-helix transcriptional regulator [Halosimplex salinum]